MTRLKRHPESGRCFVPILVLLWAAAFLFVPGGRRVYADTQRENLPVLKMTLLAEFGLPSGSGALEGGTAAPSGYVMAFLKGTNSSNPILRLDRNSWNSIPVSPLPSLDLSHANDMCYVPKSGGSGEEGEIFVTPMDEKNKVLFVLKESSLTLDRTIQTPQNYHAIGYDAAQDLFAAVYETKTKSGRSLTCDILKIKDDKCKVVRSFPTDTNLTYQGLGVNGSLIYYTCWERGGTSYYEPVYDGVFEAQDNLIYIYDFNEKLVRTVLITMPEGLKKFEVETASFFDGKMYLQFNETTASGQKLAGIYQADGEGPTLAQAEAQRKAEEERAAKEKAAKEALGKALQKLEASRPKIRSTARKKKSLKLKWKKMKLVSGQALCYEIQVCRSRSFTGESLITEITGKTSLTVRKLKRRKNYYVRIRAYYEDGSRVVCSRWSKVKKLKTR